MATSNPFLTDKAIRNARQDVVGESSRMTVSGTVNKISILLLVVAVSAAMSWSYVSSDPANMAKGTPLMIGGMIVGLVLSLVVGFKPHLAPKLAVPFALAEGLFLGVMSAIYQVAAYPDIILHAVLLTTGTALSMFLLYRTGVIVVTDRMRSIAFTAMGGIFLVYLASFALSMFGVQVPMIHDSGPIGIGFSALVLVIAAFMLLVDFDMIEKMSEGGAPKSMEWFGAFALLITLVWLYMEFLRLLNKLRD